MSDVNTYINNNIKYEWILIGSQSNHEAEIVRLDKDTRFK